MNKAGGPSGVNFDQGVRVHITAMDGNWRRACIMSEVSQTGAKLSVNEGIDKLDLSEFMLLLTPTGIVSRRCELVSADGDELMIRFVAADRKKPSR